MIDAVVRFTPKHPDASATANQDSHDVFGPNRNLKIFSGIVAIKVPLK